MRRRRYVVRALAVTRTTPVLFFVFDADTDRAVPSTESLDEKLVASWCWSLNLAVERREAGPGMIHPA
jgi:hypothetical protein